MSEENAVFDFSLKNSTPLSNIHLTFTDERRERSSHWIRLGVYCGYEEMLAIKKSIPLGRNLHSTVIV